MSGFAVPGDVDCDSDWEALIVRRSEAGGWIDGVQSGGRLFVGGLPLDVSRADVFGLMGGEKKVLSVRLPAPRKNFRYAVAFVDFICPSIRSRSFSPSFRLSAARLEVVYSLLFAFGVLPFDSKSFCIFVFLVFFLFFFDG